MNKTIKIISVLLIILMLAVVATPVLSETFASTVGDVTIPDGEDKMTDDMKAKIGNVITTLRNLSLIIAVVVLVILGIKYMMGSVEEKAEYKKSFIPLVIGIIVVVSAIQIADFIYNFVK